MHVVAESKNSTEVNVASNLSAQTVDVVRRRLEARVTPRWVWLGGSGDFFFIPLPPSMIEDARYIRICKE